MQSNPSWDCYLYYSLYVFNGNRSLSVSDPVYIRKRDIPVRYAGSHPGSMGWD